MYLYPLNNILRIKIAFSPRGTFISVNQSPVNTLDIVNLMCGGAMDSLMVAYNMYYYKDSEIMTIDNEQ